MPLPRAIGPADKQAGRTEPRPALNFAAIARDLSAKPSRPVSSVTFQAAPLAHMPYNDELALKNQTLARFWRGHRLPAIPMEIIASPRPRKYRTTSRRRAFLRGPYLFLSFGDKLSKNQKKGFLESPLELPQHTAIYTFLQRKLSEPSYKLLASHLNHLIIRGNYREMAVIFNVKKMDGPLVRKLKMVAEHLQKLKEPVTAAFAYLDPTGSDYYFEKRRPDDKMQFKKLFGPAQLEIRFGQSRFQFHPTSFSQVNESLVETMLQQALTLLAPDGNEQLADLYCGYGLFSHYLAAEYKKIIGIDAEGPSIRAAKDNAKLNRTGAKCRFMARNITPKAIADLLPPSSEPLTVILDPPRQGPQRGVIAALGERQPQKVLHIFCGVDQIPESLKEWEANNYRVEKVVPLDMFPGTPNLEVLILLKRKTSGG